MMDRRRIYLEAANRMRKSLASGESLVVISYADPAMTAVGVTESRRVSDTVRQYYRECLAEIEREYPEKDR